MYFHSLFAIVTICEEIIYVLNICNNMMRWRVNFEWGWDIVANGQLQFTRWWLLRCNTIIAISTHTHTHIYIHIYQAFVLTSRSRGAREGSGGCRHVSGKLAVTLQAGIVSIGVGTRLNEVRPVHESVVDRSPPPLLPHRRACVEALRHLYTS